MRTPPRPRRPLRAIAALALAAGSCTTSAAPPPAGMNVTDSAGVTIVESNRPEWTPETAWHVSVDPALVIGAATGAPEYQLYRVGDAVRLPDGRIVIENAGTELRFYAPDGAFIRTVGREGEGPGEFTALNGLDLLGDTLLAYDRGTGRLSMFDLEGRLIDDVSLEFAGTEMGAHSYSLGGVLGDAILLEAWAFDAGMRDRPGVYWDSLPHRLYDLDGASLGHVGRYGGLEVYTESHRSTYLPFGRMTSSDVGDAGLHTGDGSWSGYEVYDRSGSLTRIVRGPGARPRVDAALVEAWVLGPLREAMAGLGDEATRREEIAFYENLPYPERVPAFSDLVVDVDGRVWLQEYRYRRMTGPTAWSVFDVDGAFLGTVELPRHVDVSWIGEDEILGTWTDELGVEFVLAYGVIRPPGP